MSLRIAIIGGGIRGVALAAILARVERVSVTLFERSLLASGATRANHGRLHSGAGLWKTRFGDVARRRLIGATIMSHLPSILDSQLPAVYCITQFEDIQQFEFSCQSRKIPHIRLDVSNLQATIGEWWIGNLPFCAAYEIPEYAFNPARVVFLLARYAAAHGAKVYLHSPVHVLEIAGSNRITLRYGDGEIADMDVVINAAGSWINSITSPLPILHLPIQLLRWRLLCLPSANLPEQLNRVVTVIDHEDRGPSAIPHGGWVAFGSGIDPERVPSPDESSLKQWRLFDVNDSMDVALLKAHRRYFPALQQSEGQLYKDLYSFSSTYPSLPDERESICQTYFDDAVPSYFLVHGGNATTALLDAAETAERVLARVMSSQLTAERMLSALVADLSTASSASPSLAALDMIWDVH
jgi:glycine/D-amino acid oxidase-like deaminating enzyme